MRWLILPLLLTGCGVGLFQDNRSTDPKSCRERAGYRVASVYPDPHDLDTAIDAICTGVVEPDVTTTTRPP